MRTNHLRCFVRNFDSSQNPVISASIPANYGESQILLNCILQDYRAVNSEGDEHDEKDEGPNAGLRHRCQGLRIHDDDQRLLMISHYLNNKGFSSVGVLKEAINMC